MTQLVRYEQARQALAACHSVDEVKEIRDKAEAMAAYARLAKDTDMILWATEIKVRAERQAGAMLSASAASGERAGRSEGGKHAAAVLHGKSHDSTSHPPTLSEIGITKDQSSRWQSLASMTDEHFETAVATAKDTAGQVTTAFMLREAGKAHPSKRLNKSDKEKLNQIEERKGASMLAGYARMVLKGLREAESLSQEERTTLAALRDEINSALAH